jgi:hypothetical protein
VALGFGAKEITAKVATPLMRLAAP